MLFSAWKNLISQAKMYDVPVKHFKPSLIFLSKGHKLTLKANFTK
jgi:hypothetical protein